MKLTLRTGNFIDDWYVIERAEHDGREWMEKIDEHSYSFQTSARFSDADVEGTKEEMLAIANAIRKRSYVSFKRCAVHARHESVEFWSPRNSQNAGVVPLEDAIALADEIEKKFLEL